MTDEALPVLDQAQVADLLALDQGKGALFAKFVGLFIDATPARIQKMRAQSESADLVALANSAHSLRGTAGNVGAVRLSSVLERIESAAKGGDSGRAIQAVGLLEAEFAAARAALFVASNA